MMHNSLQALPMSEATRTQLYAAFQIARNALIDHMAVAGMSNDDIAKAISMVPLQVGLIVTRQRETEGKSE